MIEDYLSKWNLQDPILIAETPMGVIYKVQKDNIEAILKVFTPLGVKDESGGSNFLKHNFQNGVVKLLEVDEGAQLLELLEGENLYHFSKNGEEEKASQIFVEIIKAIQKTPIQVDLKPIEELFTVFDRVTLPEKLRGIEDDVRKKCEDLTKSKEQDVLLHGDLHHENVLKNSLGEYVCFDPKGYIGDPAYEITTILKNPWDYPEVSHDRDHFIKRLNFFSEKLEIPRERILGYTQTHLLMSLAWAIEDEVDYSHQENVLKLLMEINL